MTAAAPTAASAYPATTRARTIRRLQVSYGCSQIAANVAGGAIVFLFLGFELPSAQRSFLANIIALVAYCAFSLLLGDTLSAFAFNRIKRAVAGDGPISHEDRVYIVRHPLRQAGINFAMWLGAEAVFVPINLRYGARNDVDVATTILLGGLTTCGLTYLLAERVLRPVNGIAFEDELPPEYYVPGVKSRFILAWAVGTGIPVLGITSMSIGHSSHRPISAGGLAFLGVVTIATSFVAVMFAAKSVADPVESVTSALAAVEAENLDVRVPVYDGSQIGRLQRGFNAMVEGLRERRRLRDLFGRQVGVEVAKRALEHGVRLGGEQAQAAVLFVDLIGSTEMAATRPPTDVVATLNAFFGVVVDVVDRHGGFVNKFEGDGALCVFGVPLARDDAASCALQAARVLHQRLRELHGLSAAIGVSCGSVVAGNVGARERFEYTVIGDAVNEAARLTDLAKGRELRVLASAAVLRAADEHERAHWDSDGEAVTLRGRTAPTTLATLR